MKAKTRTKARGTPSFATGVGRALRSAAKDARKTARTFGRGNADTMVENCGNSLILRCSSSEHGGTSEFASKLIGQREVIRTSRSRSRRPLHLLTSTTHSEQLRTEAAVMASEIERLPDLQGFLKLASLPDWRAVTLTRCAGPSGPGTMA